MEQPSANKQTSSALSVRSPPLRDRRRPEGIFRKHAMLKALRAPTTLLNSQLLASRTPSSSVVLRVGAHAARSYATETPLPSTSSANPVGKNGKDEEPSGALRPHLGVEVNPNHGLWAFFRKAVGKDGAVTYETLEAKDDIVDYSGAFLL